jgi:MinD-like ATPase involved in chromosome partitioning or flagellar assembly
MLLFAACFTRNITPFLLEALAFSPLTFQRPEESSMKSIFTLANAKGGCGKTTVSLNLAICFARQRWLSIWTSKATYRLPWESTSIAYRLQPTGYSSMKRRTSANSCRCPSQPIAVIDTPPAMRTATMNGLAVADTLIIPVDSSYFALLGLNQLLQVVAAIRDAHKPDMVIRALTSMYNRRQNLDKEIRKRIEDFFGEELVLETAIHKNVGIAEAAALQKAVVEYSPVASGAFDFTRLMRELEEVNHEEPSALRVVGKS